MKRQISVARNEKRYMTLSHVVKSCPSGLYGVLIPVSKGRAGLCADSGTSKGVMAL